MNIVTIQPSLLGTFAQASLDVGVALALFVALRAFYFALRSWRYHRERVKRDAECLAVFRAKEQEAWDRRHASRGRRARRRAARTSRAR